MKAAYRTSFLCWSLCALVGIELLADDPPDMIATSAVTILLTHNIELPGLIQKDENGKDVYEVDPDTNQRAPSMTTEREWTITTYRVPSEEADPKLSVETNEKGIRLTKWRYGNREILLDMLDDDLLDGDTTISGWKIVGVYESVNVEIGGVADSVPMPNFVARKVRGPKNVSIVDVPLNLSATTVKNLRSKTVNKESTRYIREDGEWVGLDPVTSTSFSHSTSHVGQGTVSIGGEEDIITLQGAFSGSTKVVKQGYSWREEVEYNEDGDTKLVTRRGSFFVNLPGPLRVFNISSFAATPEGVSYVDGSVNVARSAAIRPSAFAPQPDDEL